MTDQASTKQQAHSADQTVSLSNLRVGGIKSISNRISLSIRPLTILAGTNSSGKSSAMQSLLLLKQTLETDYEIAGLRIDGPNARFTSRDQLLSKSDPKSKPRLFIELQFGNDFISVEYAKSSRELYCVRQRQRLNGRLTDLTPRTLTSTLKKYFGPESGDASTMFLEIFSEAKGIDFRYRISRDKGFLSPSAEVRHQKNNQLIYSMPSSTPNPSFLECLRKLIHIPGLRGQPERTYKRMAAGPFFTGTFPQYVASIVARWQQTGDRRLDRLRAEVTEMGLTWKVATKPVDDSSFELLVGMLPRARRGGAGDLVSIADVGLGVSQALPILVAMQVAEPGRIVYIEQPELHLHPRGQVRIAQILARHAMRGVRIIVETHSRLFLLAIQSEIAKNPHRDPDWVALHWFSRGKDGASKVSTAQIDKDGSYGSWQVDFDDVSSSLELEFLKNSLGK